MKKFVFSTVLVFVFALIFVACGSTPKVGGTSVEKLPDWVKKGVPGSFCGIDAMVIGQDDLTTAFNFAESRARGELAAHVKTLVRSWLEDYRAQIQDGSTVLNEADSEKVMTQLVNLSTEMTQLHDTAFVPSEKNAKYVFKAVCFDLGRYAQAFDRSIDQLKGISETRKQEMKAEKKRLMDKMEAEIAKTEGAKKAEAEYNDAPEGKPER